ncbi:hypothetical protein D3C73_1409550 [compost metagenome]
MHTVSQIALVFNTYPFGYHTPPVLINLVIQNAQPAPLPLFIHGTLAVVGVILNPRAGAFFRYQNSVRADRYHHIR